MFLVEVERRAVSAWGATAPGKSLLAPVAIPAIMAGVGEVELVAAHHERATLRVGGVFLKIDANQGRTDVEIETMATVTTTEATSAGPTGP